VDEAFVNGVRIGGCGTFPPQYQTAYFMDRVYMVPASLLRYDGTDVLAVRVFDGPGSGGIVDAPAMTGDRVAGRAFRHPRQPRRKTHRLRAGGVGWYRKQFKLAAAKPRQVRVRTFRAASTWTPTCGSTAVHLGNHPYGYTSFQYDLAPHLKPAGQTNVLAVRVRNLGKNSRWYSGSGIYRHVWLTVAAPLHVAPYGVCVTTPDVTDKQAVVRIATTLERTPSVIAGSSDDRQAAANVQVRATILPCGMGVPPMCFHGRLARGCCFFFGPTARHGRDGRGTHGQDAHATRRDRRADAGRQKAAAMVRRFAHSLRGRRRGAPGRRGDRHCSRAVRHSHDQFRRAAGVPAQRAVAQDQGRLHAPRQRPLGSATIDRAEVRRVEIMKANGSTPFAPLTIRPPRPSWTPATAWACW